MVLLLLSGFCLGIYGGYRGVVAVYHYVTSNWYGGDSDSEYSCNRTHRIFVVKNKQPKRHIKSYGSLFSDMNDVQLEAAKKLGIKPIESKDDLEKLQGKLVELQNTRYYKIERLTQSVPYLVPDAADFLTDLGKLMQEYNGSTSRFIITSVLRTQTNVQKLRKKNGNASKNSCHCYGTTIDIVYTRFDNQGKTSDGQLKLDLARALADMRDAGYCYVRYEVKQPCFHVTVRPK